MDKDEIIMKNERKREMDLDKKEFVKL